MILIAHRGLVNGPDTRLENHPDQIEDALSQGYDCEIDLWYEDHRWMLGHDLPKYNINDDFLEKPGLWIHAKNLDALYALGTKTNLNFFWHQNDDHTLTSQGYIWSYPNRPLTKKSICLMPEWFDPEIKNLNRDCYGICSDYVEKIKEKL